MKQVLWLKKKNLNRACEEEQENPVVIILKTWGWKAIVRKVQPAKNNKRDRKTLTKSVLISHIYKEEEERRKKKEERTYPSTHAMSPPPYK